MTAKKHRKSAYVPHLLVRTAMVGVVPACAMACASSESGPSAPTDAACCPEGVAAPAYDAVANIGFDSGSPSDAPPEVIFSVGDAFFSVADRAYPESGAPDANTDGGSDARPDSRFFGVAAVAYPAYEAGNG